MITLCGFPVSNYYNKVKMAMLEKGVPFTEEHVMTGSKDEAVLSVSPLGKVPFIKTPQGGLSKARPSWTTWKLHTLPCPWCLLTRWPVPR